MNLKTWSEITPGTVNTEAGNALKNATGSYRRGRRPEFNESTCVHCFFCWYYCPDNAMITENDRVIAIDYDFCKGCGICVHECPVKNEPRPLVMAPEENK